MLSSVLENIDKFKYPKKKLKPKRLESVLERIVYVGGFG